jgi:hypothetical protein
MEALDHAVISTSADLRLSWTAASGEDDCSDSVEMTPETES